MDDIPDALIDTRTRLFFGRTETRVFIDDLIPNCDRCFLMSGKHFQTKESGFYAFCFRDKKTGDNVGPYRTYYEALRTLALTKGCVGCQFNKSLFKDAYLSFLDEKVKEQMDAIYGRDQTVKLLIDSLNDFVQAKHYLQINFEEKFGFKLFIPLVEDPVATLNLIKPCTGALDFSVKLQLLANLIRLDQQQLLKRIKMDKKINLKGSLIILQQFFEENLTNCPSEAISVLRSVMGLRNIFPAHVTTPKVIKDLKVFGIDGYPLENWDRGISAIINASTTSFDKITSLIKEK